jgi:hypothetical protein
LAIGPPIRIDGGAIALPRETESNRAANRAETVLLPEFERARIPAPDADCIAQSFNCIN